MKSDLHGLSLYIIYFSSKASNLGLYVSYLLLFLLNYANLQIVSLNL